MVAAGQFMMNGNQPRPLSALNGACSPAAVSSMTSPQRFRPVFVDQNCAISVALLVGAIDGSRPARMMPGNSRLSRSSGLTRPRGKTIRFIDASRYSVDYIV